MSNLQPNCCLEFDFRKVDQHAGGKWLIHDTKRRKDNQLQSLNIRPQQLTKHICAVSIVGHFTQQPFLGIPVPCPAVKSKEPFGRSGMDSTCTHDDVIKWKHFPRNWPFVRGIHRSPVNSPHKGQWRRALMFSLICVWVKGWINNQEAGDLRRYRTHYDVTVMPVFQLLAMTWLKPWALEW